MNTRLHRTGLALVAVACSLSGCIVLPMGVHVNRPLPMDDPGRIRLGLGLASMPEVQGTVDAVPDAGGYPANPIPVSEGDHLGTVVPDFTVSVLKSMDVGYGVRGVYALWQPLRFGHWAFAVTPAYGVTRSESNTNPPRSLVERGTLSNVNVTGLVTYSLNEESPETLFAYVGGGDNLYTTKISVTEASPSYSLSASDHASAPTVLIGVGAHALAATLNVEGGATMLKERDGRKDRVLTVAGVLSWSFNLF